MITTKLFLIGLTCGLVASVEQEGDDPLDWLRDTIPGEPGVDYPIQASIQETSFTCDGLVFGGYYSDQEQQCQVYHVCLRDPVDPEVLAPVSFLCPNGTVFNMEVFVCDWWFNVDCSAAASLYAGVEGAFGSVAGAGGESGDVGECPAPPYGGSEEECAGIVSNCWSPGQRDTDCPNNGLCCFDGCADTCVDGPIAPPPPPPEVSPVEAETELKPDVALPPPPPQTTPPPPPPTLPPVTQPPPVVTEGYEYPIPEVPLELPKPSPPPPGVPTLYGPPPI